jgi:nickel transport protein
MNRTWLIVLLSLLLGGTAHAHRLTVNWEVRDGTLVIEGLAGGAAAAGADVELRSASGTLLEAGMLDQDGVYKWPVKASGDITVVVNAGPGHRRTLAIQERQLQAPPPAVADRSLPGTVSPEPAWHAHGSSDDALPTGIKVVVGLAFLLAASAAWMSYRNMIRTSKIERLLREHEGRG